MKSGEMVIEKDENIHCNIRRKKKKDIFILLFWEITSQYENLKH